MGRRSRAKPPRHYHVSENGRVFSGREGEMWREKALTVCSGGYLATRINGVLTRVHRLVAERYVPNPQNLPHVNHKDGDKTNNRWSNLEWVTNSQNAYHAMAIGLHANPAKPVVGVSEDGRGLWLRASSEAGYYGMNRENINKCCRGERKLAHGMEWRLYEQV